MGKISSIVFEDLNADGIKDPGELGIQGVTVKLSDRRERIIATTTTDVNGIYTFDNLKLSEYRVMFENPDDGVYEFSPRQVGDDWTLDSDGAISDLFLLRSREFNNTINAGLFRRAKLGNFVFEDLNQNGIQDEGEPGIAGAKVNLYDSNGNFLGTAQANTDGFYEFSDLTPGNYRVEFIQPDGFDGVSPFQVGGNSEINSDANPNNGLMSGVITLTSGEENYTIDAGFFKQTSQNGDGDVVETPIIPQSEPYSTFERFNSGDELEKYLVDNAIKKYSNLFGKELSFWYSTTSDVSLDSAVSGSVTTEAFSASGDFSQTNTQEQGVDEADLVETDGSYIYQVIGSNLTIVDARNSEKLNIASETDLKNLGNIQGAYLYEDKLTVISTASPWQFWSTSFIDYNPVSFNPTVNVSVFDVSDPTSVVLEEKSELDGYLLSSRAVGDQVYVITQAAFGLPQPQLIPTQGDIKELSLDASVSKDTTSISILPYGSQRYETQAEYLARLKGQVLEQGLPTFTTIDGAGKILQEGLLNQAQNIYKPLEENPLQLTSVSVFDVDDNQPGPQSSKGIPTSGAREIYSSLDNLYLLEPDAAGTDLLKVNLDTLDLVAVGEAPGRVLNQFSVDEDNGFLRIATSTGFGDSSKNHLYVLEQQGQKLEIVVSIEGIAPGERMYSARFEGDKGFMVTFVEKDPFFTFDLSKPTSPKLVGELELPGFSNYLQVIENENTTQVLGIGREGSDLKVTLFDVTDLKNPQEVNSFVFEGNYSSSEATWDQQAVSYFPEYETLAIPFWGNLSQETALRVFDVDPQKGFTTKGDIIHEGGRIQRSLRIGDDLYVISNKQVTAHNLNTLKQISEVNLPDSSSPIYPFLTVDPVLTGGTITLGTDSLRVSATTDGEPINETLSFGSGDAFGSITIDKTENMTSISGFTTSGISDTNQLIGVSRKV